MKSLIAMFSLMALTISACGVEDNDSLRYCDASGDHACPAGTSCSLDTYTCVPDRLAPRPPAEPLTRVTLRQCAPVGAVCDGQRKTPCCGRCVAGRCVPSICGGEGACAGKLGPNGRCVYPSVGTVCRASCSGSGALFGESVATCDSQHRCVAGADRSCGPYRCNPDTNRCHRGCGTDPDDRHKECIFDPDVPAGISVCDRSQAHSDQRFGLGVCVDPRQHKVALARPSSGIRRKGLASAIAALGRAGYVRVKAGNYRGPITVQGKVKVALVADGKVTLSNDSTKQYTLGVGDGAEVMVQGFAIRGAAQSGISCEGQSGSWSKITVLESDIAGSDGMGIYADGCTSELRRNTIRSNRVGGLVLLGGQHIVINNVIARNGTDRYNGVGGFVIRPVSADALWFAHNTVAYNRASAGISAAGSCTPSLRLYNSIFYGNIDAAPTRRTLPTCQPVRSLVEVGANAKRGNFSADPLFRAPAKDQFMLRPGSPARDQADKIHNGSQIDIVGTVRDTGTAADLGAYEARSI